MRIKNIAIIAGGYSSEYVISLKSARGIYSFIDKEKYNVHIVVITKDKWVVQTMNEREISINKNNFSFTYKSETIYFDFAYITIHGAPGENGQLQGYFDMLGIPYSCCGVLAASLTFNKYYCNHYLNEFGIRTAPSLLLRSNEMKSPEAIAAKLGFPLFVKPNNSGSSFGITKVHEIEQIQPAVTLAFKEGTEVIVERFMPGTEITCGCYRTKNKMTIFPITEVISKNDFFDYDAKYNPASVEEITPARIHDKLTKEVQYLTSQIYDLTGAKGIIRVDYIISPEGNIQMLEVNTTPGMTETSFIPQQVYAAGLNMTTIITDIIENR